MRLQEEIASYSKYTSKILGKSSCGSDQDIGGAGHFWGYPHLDVLINAVSTSII